MDYWKIDTEKTEEHWLEVNDPEGWYHAVVSYDGCIHLYRLHNTPLPITNEHPQLVNYIHICEIDDMINRLTKLKEIAQQFFN